LPAVLDKVDRAESLAERREQTAGADRRQLLRLADQDYFSFRPLDQFE
jgi:hypothetical protein